MSSDSLHRSASRLVVVSLLALAGTASASEHLRYGFDAVTVPVSAVADDSGSGNAGTVASNGQPGASLTLVTPGEGGGGQAVSFPAVCPNSNTSCPRVLMTAADDPSLNPGTADFSYGVSVRVTLAELTADHGSNLLQKGLWNTSQWKVQLDDATGGKPSCVLRPVSDPAGGYVKVKSSVGVADGAWHRIACVRAGDTVTILIDGVARGSKAFTGEVSPTGRELSIGGSGTQTSNDQFHGDLDGVFFEMAGAAPAIDGLLFDFEAASNPVTVVADDAGNGHDATVSTNGNPGAGLATVSPGSGGLGQAIAFPASCPNTDSTCPRAVLTAPDAADLNPGTGDFSYGVRLRVTAAELGSDHGGNLLQKGMWNTSQWKLQLEPGSTGQVSCVLRPVSDPAGGVVKVKSIAGLSDGAWHEVSCLRSAGTLTLFVDGVSQGSKPFAGDVTPSGQPLTVGASGAYLSNDQFHGQLDHVWFENL